MQPLTITTKESLLRSEQKPQKGVQSLPDGKPIYWLVMSWSINLLLSIVGYTLAREVSYSQKEKNKILREFKARLHLLNLFMNIYSSKVMLIRKPYYFGVVQPY